MDLEDTAERMSILSLVARSAEWSLNDILDDLPLFNLPNELWTNVVINHQLFINQILTWAVIINWHLQISLLPYCMYGGDDWRNEVTIKYITDLSVI